MKLVNKNTTNIKAFGEIVPCNEYGCIAVKTDKGVTWYYRSLAELNEEWEDYEEPKEPKKYWYIIANGEINSIYEEDEEEEDTKATKEIGNYFETREEAELAVRKLKAWKRLKDNGFKFAGYSHYDCSGDESPAIAFEYSDLDEMFDNKHVVADLDLLFGGEE